MSHTISDFLIKRITDGGIRRIYGFIGAIDGAGDAIEYVQVRHDERSFFADK